MKLPPQFNRFKLAAPASNKIQRRLVMTSEAETGCGKSDFMFRSAPRPLLIIDLDHNLEALEEKYPSDEIVIHTVDIPAKYTSGNKAHKERDYKIVMEIQDLFSEAVAANCFRSIFIDTNNALWELARRGLLDGGGVDFGSDKRTDYAPANNYMSSFFDLAKTKRINFCMSSHVKDEYKGANSTGKRVAGGWKGAIQASQCHVRLYKDVKKDKDDVIPEAPDKFHLEVLKCSMNSDLEGFVLDGEEVALVTLGKLIFPQSEEEDWYESGRG